MNSSLGLFAAAEGRGASPNGGPVSEREHLSRRFASRLSVNDYFSRKVVSYQGNRGLPGLRWMRYKEGFSHQLVSDLIDQHRPRDILDPFAGICTTPLVASGKGVHATGVEIMPVGVLAGTAIATAANGLLPDALDVQGSELLGRIRARSGVREDFSFPHVPITEGAFPKSTEKDLARARAFIADVADEDCRALLNFACMSVLEDVSYTRKDGQYLRWDHRAGRALRSKVDKGPIRRFPDALEERLSDIAADIAALKARYGGRRPKLITGSCLEILREFPDGAFDMVITSPPYANRYDYTRTYALELAWLNFDRAGFSGLRQRMLSATVENKPKRAWFEGIYGKNREMLDRAVRMHGEQGALHEVLGILREHAAELSNRNVLRLVEHYFLEMATVVAELGRIVRPGGTVIMVNDNVQYHGEELPVDFILSDFAEQSGFSCTDIWQLPRGKGNSSQQMARFGRRELRKCVYRWTREHA